MLVDVRDTVEVACQTGAVQPRYPAADGDCCADAVTAAVACACDSMNCWKNSYVIGDSGAMFEFRTIGMTAAPSFYSGRASRRFLPSFWHGRHLRLPVVGLTYVFASLTGWRPLRQYVRTRLLRCWSDLVAHRQFSAEYGPSLSMRSIEYPVRS